MIGAKFNVTLFNASCMHSSLETNPQETLSALFWSLKMLLKRSVDKTLRI